MGVLAWYSDFDGVFNIPQSSGLTVTAAIEPENSDFLVNHRSISWNPEVLEIFMEMLATGKYDFTWLTTWNDAGNIELAAKKMGISEVCKHITAQLDKEARGKKAWTRWKAETIIADQANNPRPYIWVDDEAPTFWEDHVRGHTLAPSLVIKTHNSKGLTKKDLVKIIDWTLENQHWGRK